MDSTAIKRLAFDLTKNNVRDHTADEGSEVLRQALVDINGGALFDMKKFRRNKIDLYEIIEETIPVILNEVNRQSVFFNRLVEERNAKEGDRFDFVVPDNSEFVVAEIARGIATPRRQRIGEKRTVSVIPTSHALRIYEEFSRFMAGRINWNELVNSVANAFNNKLFEDIYAALSGITASTPGLNANYVYAGTYSEEEVLTRCEHVEAATHRTPVIYGTRSALRKCTSAVISDEAKSAYYNGGYYGKLAGVDMVYIPNIHRGNTDSFVFPDNKIWILAGDARPIKYCTEGDVYMTDKMEGNDDMSIEFTMISRYAVALIVGAKLGVCTFS